MANRNSWLMAALGLLMAAGCGSGGRIYPLYLPMRQGTLFGYMDEAGEQVIAPQFAYAVPFSEGLGGVNVGGSNPDFHMPRDGKWGFIRPDGSFRIPPVYFSPPVEGLPFDPEGIARGLHEAYRFSEGLAAVYTEDGWAYIDTAGVVKMRLPGARSLRCFREGLANVYSNGRWGYIDRNGEWRIQPNYLYPVDFRNGFAVVMDGSGKKIILDRSLGGQPRVYPEYRIETHFYDGVAGIRNRFRGDEGTDYQNRRFGVMDTLGRILFEPIYDEVGRYGNGLIPVLVGSRTGNPMTSPVPPGVSEYPGGRWGFADTAGRLRINPTYDGARGYSEGFAAVKSGNLWAYMDDRGRLVTDFEFEWCGYFHDGLAAVRLGYYHSDYEGKYARINTDGDIIWIEPE
ncbi:MAG: WG repeat-containing protein [Bacteroidia bacterium]|nr:WG repeat-containing protein [Bacteroidia bacterium]